jgi:hypothetical protein
VEDWKSNNYGLSFRRYLADRILSALMESALEMYQHYDNQDDPNPIFHESNAFNLKLISVKNNFWTKKNKK